MKTLKNRVSQIEARVEIKMEKLSERLNDLALHVQCGVTCGHHITLTQYFGTFFVFRCTNCGLKYGRAEENLTKKEKKLVELVFDEPKGRK